MKRRMGEGKEGDEKECICERGVFPHFLSVGCENRCLDIITLYVCCPSQKFKVPVVL